MEGRRRVQNQLRLQEETTDSPCHRGKRATSRWNPPGPGELPDGAPRKQLVNIFALSFDMPSGTNSRTAAGISFLLSWGLFLCNSFTVSSLRGANEVPVNSGRARNTWPRSTLFWAALPRRCCSSASELTRLCGCHLDSFSTGCLIKSVQRPFAKSTAP